MDNRQELFCHACNKYVTFDVPEANGRLIVRCPDCGHRHYRIVKDGIITDDRWRSSSSPIMWGGNATTANISFVTSTSSAGSYTAQSWLNSTATTSTGTW